MLNLLGMLFQKAWVFMNLSYSIDGFTIKLYYPFMFMTICVMVWNLIFVTANGVGSIDPVGLRENVNAYRQGVMRRRVLEHINKTIYHPVNNRDKRMVVKK
jgi:hypothetical protein